jgi:hypothetical protein
MTAPHLQRSLFRVSALLLLSGYVAIMAPLFRQDLQVATLGDTLVMQRRDLDAQVEQNDREFVAARKRREDVAYLKDERRALMVQGLQATREIQDWKTRKALWTSIYWSVFALAHAVVLPLAFWMFAAASAASEKRPSHPVATPRKRTLKTPRSRLPKLVEGTDSR